MIVDCHTHIWESEQQLGGAIGLCRTQSRTATRPEPLNADTAEHQICAQPVDKTIVLAVKSHYLQADVPNEYIANYVRQQPDRLVGFAGIDPTRPKQAIEELQNAHDQLDMKGVNIWPAGQGCHPASTGAMQVYAEVSRLGMPVMFHQDAQAATPGKMEFARPVLLDEVAREFGDLKIIISQMGMPWIGETIALLNKHPNVFADISGLVNYPWKAYDALIQAYQAGVMTGLLFGSNFPSSTAAECIEALYSINQFCQGTNLPSIPREQLRQIVERDALSLLGIESPQLPPQEEPDKAVIQAEE